jgi:hypothetical protein
MTNDDYTLSGFTSLNYWRKTQANFGNLAA